MDNLINHKNKEVYKVVQEFENIFITTLKTGFWLILMG